MSKGEASLSAAPRTAAQTWLKRVGALLAWCGYLFLVVPSLIVIPVSLSGSGVAVKGPHLIDPRTGLPATRTTRVWALAGSAAMSDALSTAFFIMSDSEIANFCAQHPEIGAAVTSPQGVAAYGALRRD